MASFLHVYTVFSSLMLANCADVSDFTSNLLSPLPIATSLVEKYLDLVNNYVLGTFKDSYWCYDSSTCFQIGGPFISVSCPISYPPYPFIIFPVRMQLYTRSNPETPFSMAYPKDLDQIGASPFNSSLPTKFLVGGYLNGDGRGSLIDNVTTRLLQNLNCNVFIVNWYVQSVTTYIHAVANTRMVGIILGRFIEYLNKTTGMSIEDAHIIGHSLGAHIAGHAGEYLAGKIGRISGLDPAGPCYQNTDPIVRLDVTDAIFVDIIHTNKGNLLTGHYGIDQVIGDVDVFVNGGEKQPNCSDFFGLNLGAIGNDVSYLNYVCSHVRAIDYYAESVPVPGDDCQFISYPCSSYKAFESHSCTDNCGNTVQMGYNSYIYAENNPIPAPCKFYVDTNGAPPYCKTTQGGQVTSSQGNILTTIVKHITSLVNRVLR